MSVLRTKKDEKRYQAYLQTKGPGCDFCTLAEGNPQFISATTSFKVIHNRFPYAIWDGQSVADHLLIVPKEHLTSMRAFTPKQAVEYLDLVSSYEENGYHVYARAVDSVARTLPHQHTHLIKGIGTMKHVILQITKPHILIMR